MKLSNQQITALASRVYNDINSKRNKANAEILNKNNKITSKLLSTAARNILEDYFKITSPQYTQSSINSYIDSYIKNKYRDKLLPLQSNVISQKNIENEIIIETIECENLDELITKITKKFS